jgi:hypothetical protein
VPNVSNPEFLTDFFFGQACTFPAQFLTFLLNDPLNESVDIILAEVVNVVVPVTTLLFAPSRHLTGENASKVAHPDVKAE